MLRMRTQQQTTEQLVEVLAPMTQKSVRQQIAGQLVEVPAPMTQEAVVHVPQTVSAQRALASGRSSRSVGSFRRARSMSTTQDRITRGSNGCSMANTPR